jgi:oligosaccharide repeat unit polymerase
MSRVRSYYSSRRINSSLWISPPLLLTWVWAFVVLLRGKGLIQYPPLSTDVIVFLFCSYLALVLSYVLFAVPIYNAKAVRVTSLNDFQIKRIIALATIFAIIGLIGALYRGLDIFFGRGLDFSQGIGSARLENIGNVEAGGAAQNPLAGIGRIMTNFSSIAAMALVLRWENFTIVRIRLIAVIFFVVLMLSILEGGRNTIAVNFVLLGACVIVRRHQGRIGLPGGNTVRRVIQILSLLLPTFIIYVFIDRFEALGYGMGYAVTGLENGFNVQFSDAVVRSNDELIQGILTGLAATSLYFTHTLNELEWVMEWVKHNDLAGGAYNFYLIALALTRMGLPDITFDLVTLTRPGVYVSALGEFAIDFGLIGAIVVCAVIGAILGRGWLQARRRVNVSGEIWLALGLAGLLVSPLYSIIPSFLGLFIGAALFGLFLPRVSSKTNISPKPFK